MRFGEVVPLDRNCGHKGPARQGGFRQPAVPRRPREADTQGCGREAPARQGTGTSLPGGIRPVPVTLHWAGEGSLPESALQDTRFRREGGLHRLCQPDRCGDGNEIRTQTQLRGGHPYGRPGARRCGNGPLRLGMGWVPVPGLWQKGVLWGPYREISLSYDLGIFSITVSLIQNIDNRVAYVQHFI